MFAILWTYLYTNTYFVRLCGDGLMKAIASDRERVCPITIKFIAIMRRSISRRAYKHNTARLLYSYTHTHFLSLTRTWAVFSCPILCHRSKAYATTALTYTNELQSWARPANTSATVWRWKNRKFMTSTHILWWYGSAFCETWEVNVITLHQIKIPPKRIESHKWWLHNFRI